MFSCWCRGGSGPNRNKTPPAPTAKKSPLPAPTARISHTLTHTRQQQKGKAPRTNGKKTKKTKPFPPPHTKNKKQISPAPIAPELAVHSLAGLPLLQLELRCTCEACAAHGPDTSWSSKARGGATRSRVGKGDDRFETNTASQPRPSINSSTQGRTMTKPQPSASWSRRRSGHLIADSKTWSRSHESQDMRKGQCTCCIDSQAKSLLRLGGWIGNHVSNGSSPRLAIL